MKYSNSFKTLQSLTDIKNEGSPVFTNTGVLVQWLGVFHSIHCSISALKLYKDISKKMKPSNRVQKFLFDLVLLLFKVWPRSSDIVWPFWSQSVHSILNSYVPLKLIVPRNKYKVISSLKDPPLYKLQLMLTRF